MSDQPVSQPHLTRNPEPTTFRVFQYRCLLGATTVTFASSVFRCFRLGSIQQRAVSAAGHEVQQVRLRGYEGHERDLPLLWASGRGREHAGFPQDHAAAQVRAHTSPFCVSQPFVLSHPVCRLRQVHKDGFFLHAPLPRSFRWPCMRVRDASLPGVPGRRFFCLTLPVPLHFDSHSVSRAILFRSGTGCSLPPFTGSWRCSTASAGCWRRLSTYS